MLFKLPEDLLPHIISFFSLKEIYHCLQFVSKEWMQISKPPSLYHKKKGTYPENSYQQWTSYIVSSFQIGKQFREFNSIDDDDKNPICNVVWDDNHTELIFSCMERRMVSGLLEGKMLVKTTGIDEMIKSMQFLYGVHYDKELVKRIKDDSSIQSCIYAEHEEFFTCYQDRLKDNSNSVKESFYFMDLCYLESNLKGVGDELFYYKLFERVFALDLDYDWSKVFPAIRKCKLLKQKRGEESNRELIRKMFLLELEVALKMLGNICEWSFYQSNLDVLYQFAHYCKSTQSQSEMIVKLSNSLINQINRLVLSEAVILTPIIDRDISVLDFKDNTLIQLFNENEMTLELVDYRSLYTNVSFVLEFLYRNFSVADMLRRTDKRHRVIEPINILNGYIEQYILNHKDLEKRVCFYEKIVQAFVYAVELKDFKTAFFFVNIFNTSSISRLRKTSQLAESPNNFNTLLNESLSKLSSDSNFRKLYQTIQKYAHESSVPINLPLTSLTFVMEGNSNQNVILLFSYKIISEFGRTLKIPSKIGKFERELLEKKIVKIIDKKGLKESIKSFFEGGDSINFQHQLQTDRELLELFVCIVLKFQPQPESELWKMSLVCEPRQSNK